MFEENMVVEKTLKGKMVVREYFRKGDHCGGNRWDRKWVV